MSNGFSVLFDHQSMECRIFNEKKLWGVARERGGLWVLDGLPKKPAAWAYNTVTRPSAPPSKAQQQLRLWHKRFGHLNYEGLKRLAAKRMVEGLSFDNVGTFDHGCRTCNQGKQPRVSFPTRTGPQSTHILELVHSDLVGPISPVSFRGSKYIMTFVDDMSRMAWTYLLTLKSEAFSVFLEWKAMIENSTGRKVKTLRTDNGGEYVNRPFKDFMRGQGIIHQTTVPRTPEQNGVA